MAVPSAIHSPTPDAISTTTTTLAPTRAGPVSPLEQALALTPLVFADRAVEFADYSGYLELRGAGFAVSPEIWPYEGLRLHPMLRNMVGNVQGLLGLDLLASDFGFWAWEPGNNSPKFYLNRGGFEGEQVVRGLLNIEYAEMDHSGTRYYALRDDFGLSMMNPLGAMGVSLNRVAVVGDWLLAAPSTGILAGLIDLQNQGPGASLLDSGPHRALVNVIGERPVGGAFVTPQWIMENWNTVNTGPVERLDKHLAGPDQWGRLSPYSLAFIGYRIRGDADEIALALFYPDSGAAAVDAPELERRWRRPGRCWPGPL